MVRSGIILNVPKAKQPRLNKYDEYLLIDEYFGVFSPVGCSTENTPSTRGKYSEGKKCCISAMELFLRWTNYQKVTIDFSSSLVSKKKLVDQFQQDGYNGVNSAQ